jgi:predicted secreted protein
VFDEPADAADRSAALGAALIVTDDASFGTVLTGALEARGVKSAVVTPAQGFGPAAAQVVAAAGDGPLDAVIVALSGGAATGPGGDWGQILDEHEGIAQNIRTDAGWARAVSDYAAQAQRPVRLVTITDATSAGGWSRAQAAAQLSRAAHAATADRVDAFALSLESADDAGRHCAAELMAHLVAHADSAALSGAELVVASGFFGLRSHPNPAATISYGGPAIPSWLDGALRDIVTGTN